MSKEKIYIFDTTLRDGDLNKLAWLCPPDYSDIRKKSFWWDGVPREYIKRYFKHYAV